ncbi:MAG: helix-turn-helix domain-containing protein [Solirubrobacteraceae bacterium]
MRIDPLLFVGSIPSDPAMRKRRCRNWGLGVGRCGTFRIADLFNASDGVGVRDTWGWTKMRSSVKLRCAVTVEFEVHDGGCTGTVSMTAPSGQRRAVDFARMSELEHALLAHFVRVRAAAAQTNNCAPKQGAGPPTRSSMLAGAAALLPQPVLSQTERAVAEAAARGASNREIATSLFYSVKTIEAYLTRIYRKLDVGNRADMAAALKQPTQLVPRELAA